MKVEIEIPEKAPRYFKDVGKGEAFERPGGKLFIKTMSELQINGSMINSICLSDGASHRFFPEMRCLTASSKWCVIKGVFNVMVQHVHDLRDLCFNGLAVD